jgi:hypothetical protein
MASLRGAKVDEARFGSHVPAHLIERAGLYPPRQVRLLIAARCPFFPEEDDVGVALVRV